MDVNNYQDLLLFHRGMMDIYSKYNNNNNNQKNSGSKLPIIVLIIIIVLILFFIFCKIYNKSGSNNPVPQVSPTTINYYLQIPPQYLNQLQDRNYEQNYNNRLMNSYESRPIFHEIQ